MVSDATPVEYVLLNGTAVRVSSFRLGAATDPEGRPVQEATVVVVLRGAPAHHAFLALLAERPLRLDVPDGPSFAASLTRHDHETTGSGPATTCRHELTLRETRPSS